VFHRGAVIAELAGRDVTKDAIARACFRAAPASPTPTKEMTR
jgi:hypothetical protein